MTIGRIRSVSGTPAQVDGSAGVRGGAVGRDARVVSWRCLSSADLNHSLVLHQIDDNESLLRSPISPAPGRNLVGIIALATPELPCTKRRYRGEVRDHRLVDAWHHNSKGSLAR